MPSLEERRRQQAIIFDRVLRNNRGARRTLIRKQVSDQAHWINVWHRIDVGSLRVRDHVKELVYDAVRDIDEAIERYCPNRTPVYGWSGGKDSLALEIVCNEAGIHECCLVITDLEYPQFLRWATDNMPNGCSVVHRADINLRWLRDRPELLFPPDGVASGKWFSAVQHTGQQQYLATIGGDPLMLLGRRRLDGNFMGKDGYTRSKRGQFYSPLKGWTHEDVLMVLKCYGVEMPPMYEWPRGYQVGSGPWPARQFCRSVEHGWSEVFTIDSTVVQQAAPYFASAQEFLAKNGL